MVARWPVATPAADTPQHIGQFIACETNSLMPGVNEFRCRKQPDAAFGRDPASLTIVGRQSKTALRGNGNRLSLTVVDNLSEFDQQAVLRFGQFN